MEGTNYYTIQSAKGFCLASAGNSTASRSRVVLANCVKGDMGQTWKVDPGFDAGYRFMISHVWGLCLSVSSCTRYYTVKSGDACWSIVASQGTTMTALYAANPTIDYYCKNLQVGQVLCMATVATTTRGQQTVISGCDSSREQSFWLNLPI
ncbi:hypothetical protein GPECTOR_1g163 [Gonium pectorale]|uniref:LysM domain-containing protein n=1 Tax=Gonium pectorale TaxID=33097 RepID=A0A150H220_GONPE|nr:hypothetical protein GPECTOR_1g163 [Gonium pectorale]|eukprot:KXZ56189.1 hypothetical protein GPECTOR_1g163 [Gonium pectorale]